MNAQKIKKILMPIPDNDVDPSECAVPWQFLRDAGHQVVVATPQGQVASCDERMLSGAGLGPWCGILRADRNARQAYSALADSTEFKKPIKWSEIRVSDYDALLLPGGHAPRMKEYLESTLLQKVVADFYEAQKIIAMVCHGLVLAARSKKADGRSIIYGHQCTSLLKSQEMTAWLMTALWLGNYYRTYPESVESEVKRNLRDPSDFQSGPTPISRDTPTNLSRGFVVRDGRLLSARWPGDIHLFSSTLRLMLDEET